jgi:hypothetical protein
VPENLRASRIEDRSGDRRARAGFHTVRHTFASNPSLLGRVHAEPLHPHPSASGDEALALYLSLATIDLQKFAKCPGAGEHRIPSPNT